MELAAAVAAIVTRMPKLPAAILLVVQRGHSTLALHTGCEGCDANDDRSRKIRLKHPGVTWNNDKTREHVSYININMHRMHGFPPQDSTRAAGPAPSVYATHIKITGFSIVKIKRVTVSYF